MANEVKFTNAKIWRNDVKTENGEFSSYTVGVSSKNQDGTYTNAYLPVKFAKSSNAPEKISNGTTADIEGFLSAKARKDGRNDVQLIVMKYRSDEVEYPAASDSDIPDSFEEQMESIPF